jgi:hypothetical protein
MVDRSALVIGFSGTGSSSEGTWYTLEHAASKGACHASSPHSDQATL